MKPKFVGIHPVDDEFIQKFEFVKSLLPCRRYPLVLQKNGVDYVVGRGVSGIELLTGHYVISPCSDYGYPILCKLTDIWAD